MSIPELPPLILPTGSHGSSDSTVDPRPYNAAASAATLAAVEPRVRALLDCIQGIRFTEEDHRAIPSISALRQHHAALEKSLQPLNTLVNDLSGRSWDTPAELSPRSSEVQANTGCTSAEMATEPCVMSGGGSHDQNPARGNAQDDPVAIDWYRSRTSMRDAGVMLEKLDLSICSEPSLKEGESCGATADDSHSFERDRRDLQQPAMRRRSGSSQQRASDSLRGSATSQTEHRELLSQLRGAQTAVKAAQEHLMWTAQAVFQNSPGRSLTGPQTSADWPLKSNGELVWEIDEHGKPL